MNAPLTQRQARRDVFESNKLAKRLRREVGQAISDYAMIEAGDKVMVCLSGGKDSYAMLDVLMYLRGRVQKVRLKGGSRTAAQGTKFGHQMVGSRL